MIWNHNIRCSSIPSTWWITIDWLLFVLVFLIDWIWYNVNMISVLFIQNHIDFVVANEQNAKITIHKSEIHNGILSTTIKLKSVFHLRRTIIMRWMVFFFLFLDEIEHLICWRRFSLSIILETYHSSFIIYLAFVFPLKSYVHKNGNRVQLNWS